VPVSLLFCEGGERSPDVRVLARLLKGIAIKPAGGKYGMGQRVLAHRDALGRANAVFGLLDGDFVERWQGSAQAPIKWETGNGVQLGWRWGRKEIENYLIDPEVVRRVIPAEQLSIEHYQVRLAHAAETVAVYQAARAALAISRCRFKDLPSAFGRERGKERHPFPDDFTQASCREQLREAVGEHRESQLVEVDDVLDRFQSLLEAFGEGGERRLHFLHTFSGKDLLWALDADLKALGFPGAMGFREKLLVGIAESVEQDITNWLPEWEALRSEVFSIP
jgi:hypothetical protein